MGNERLLEYYRLFEELLRSMTEIDGFDLEQIKKALAELCKLFRISCC